MSQFDYQEFYERNLPHIQPPEATLFITFRLEGSIPQSVLDQWLMEKKKLENIWKRLAAMSPSGVLPDPEAEAEDWLNFQRRWFMKFEDELHRETCGPVWLKQGRIAEIVAEALRHRDGKVYQLDAYCVMSNHVHTVFAPYLTEAQAREQAERVLFRRRGQPPPTQTDSLRYSGEDSVLAVIMQSLKGFTARKCNLALGRSGQFWQHESYDHVVRNQAEWERTIKYVLNNPVKAGLVEKWQDWKWSYCRSSALEDQSSLTQV